MTYYELILDAAHKLNSNQITSGEYEEMIEPLKREIEQPSVTPPQPSWIPVRERMPEKTDYYLIQYSREVCPDEMAVAFYSVEEAEVDGNYTWEFKPIADCKEVIAWQPLPEPYTEGGGGE